jgi:hypothetical protein
VERKQVRQYRLSFHLTITVESLHCSPTDHPKLSDAVSEMEKTMIITRLVKIKVFSPFNYLSTTPWKLMGSASDVFGVS